MIGQFLKLLELGAYASIGGVIVGLISLAKIKDIGARLERWEREQEEQNK